MPEAEATRREVARVLAQRLKSLPESDRARPLTVRLDARLAPRLYRGTPEDARRAWRGIEDLAERGLVQVHFNRRRPADEEPFYREPRLEVLSGAFEQLAALGEVPVASAFASEWLAALADTPDLTELTARLTLLRPLPEWEALGVSGATSNLRALLALARDEPGLFLREASARLFNGDSKVLDGRSDFLAAVLGRPCTWRETPVSLLVAWPDSSLSHVVFVENLTTFERLGIVRGRFPGHAFVYSAGFRAAAVRAAGREGRSVYVDRPVPPAEQDRFLEVLDGQSQQVPVRFFGDLDFGGMAILAGLRKVYAEVTAWRPGYAPLLVALMGGVGHVPAEASKEGQLDPGATGCRYADEELLGALRATGRFLDQEWWVP